jgi:membrane fusion protein, multidrug efflux system
MLARGANTSKHSFQTFSVQPEGLFKRRISSPSKEEIVIRIKNARAAALLSTGLVMFATLTACKPGAGNTPDKAASAPVLISAEDLIKVENNSLGSGPSITGSVEPERRADLRAEVPAVVISVLKENGDPVHRGDLLVRLDQTAIRDSLNSAQASERASSQAYEQAERQFQRMSKLRETGVVSTQQVEDVEIQRNSAQSDREAARSRVVTARQLLERTEVRAPFDGIVSDRKVSAGDTTQVGKELLKVVDPTSLRFEGRVSADAIGMVKTGQHVSFRIHGFDQRDFDGRVMRVNPSANATTRQVEVLVSFVDAKDQPDVAGLYAEGRVETESVAALTLPAASIVREGDNAFAWRVKDGKLQKVKLGLGDKDLRTGSYVVSTGIAEGDSVLRYPASTLKDGQVATMSAPEKPAQVAAGE